MGAKVIGALLKLKGATVVGALVLDMIYIILCNYLININYICYSKFMPIFP
jgi:hypothetical protein